MKGIATALIVILIWGVTFANTRILLEEFSALEINLIRFSLAWITLAVTQRFFVCRSARTHQGMIPWWLFPSMGFLGIFLYQFLENCAIYYTNASNVAILVSFGPIVTALMARSLTSDRSLSIRLVVGSLLSVVGVSLVAMNGIVNFHLRPLGDMMALGAMVSWGGYSVLIDKANACGVIPVIAVQKAFGWAVIMMLPLAMWGTTDVGFITLDGSYSVTLDPSANFERFSSLSNWGHFVFLGVLASAVCFVLWIFACRILGVVKVTIGLYLTPIVGVIFSTIFLKEELTTLSVLGGILILIGVFVATIRKGVVR